MSPERLEQIQSIYLAALDQPPSKRTAFLDNACADDADLHQEVASLLAADAGENTLFDHPLGNVRGLMSDETVQPQRVGPYRILEEIGRGGMGAVYLATRDDGQFEQQVALKVIRQGFDTEEIVRRFLQERQILARLQHPNIAQLFDGGVADNKQPFFAMEYVAGTPLTTYCDKHQLDLTDRLRLFHDVCEAVHYAHQQLVVHRDLKPSNILVMDTPRSSPGQAQVKLLDFGIAKLLTDEAQGDGGMPLTQTGMRLLTPEYAAPEQVIGNPVSTSTDVYALGVLLYELLTGHRPYQFVRHTPGVIEQAILNQEPPRPSHKVSQSQTITLPDGTTETITPEQISQARRTQPHQLQRRLKGDLDVVTLKALRKEPERRYASAEAFVEDIKRYLAGMPVMARPDTPGYRVRKFVQRHRLGMFAAVLVLVSLIGGLSIAIWQARVAAQERNLARAEAQKATEIKDFLLGLFTVSDPANSKGEEITAGELLTQGAQRIETNLTNQPIVRAEMMSIMGDVYRQLGVYKKAKILEESALALRRAQTPVAPLDLLESLDNVADVYHSLGALEQADSLYREALSFALAQFGEDDSTVASMRNNVAVILADQGNYEEATVEYLASLASKRAIYGEEHPSIAATLNNLGILAGQQGAYDEALVYHQEALAIRRRLHGNLHPLTINSLINLGAAFLELGKLQDAEHAYREALEIAHTLYGDDHPDIAHIWGELGNLYLERGVLDTAFVYLEDAFAMKMRLLGKDHPDLVVAHINIGALYRSQNKYDEAETHFRKALALGRSTLGPHHPYTLNALNQIGLVLKSKGDYEAAEPIYREVMALRQAVLDPRHSDIGISLYNLAMLLRDKASLAEGENFFKQAITSFEEGVGPRHHYVAMAQSGYASLLHAQGRFVEAETLYQEALALQRETLAPNHTRTGRTLVGFGDLLTDLGRLEEALPLLREAVAIQKQSLPANHPRLAIAQAGLAHCLLKLNQTEEARVLLEHSYPILLATYPASNKWSIKVRQDLATVANDN